MDVPGIELRLHGSGPRTLVYLPGLHGDWTLVSSFRAALDNAVRFVEVTYPRTAEWSLKDYADSAMDALESHGIHRAWVLGESFGSQIAWPMIDRAPQRRFVVEGLILAGGFVRYAALWRVSLVQRINRALSLRTIGRLTRGYAAYARFRHRHAPETLAAIHEFVSRRVCEVDRQAICHRYTLIRNAQQLQAIACACRIPVYQLFGFFDPVVPWLPVRLWLRKNCPAYRGWRMIWSADHNVLATAPAESARQVLAWMDAS